MNKKIIAAVSIITILTIGTLILLMLPDDSNTVSTTGEDSTPNTVLAGGNREDSSPETEESAVMPSLASMGFKFPTEPFEAPDFTVPDISGNPVSLKSHRGKIVLLNIWATWCPPCRAEMPSMAELFDEYNDDGFTILAISSERNNDSLEKVQDFAEEYELTFPVLFDADGSFPISYYTNSIPVSYIIDKEGMILARIIGSIDWASPRMKQVIEELIS